MSLAAVGIAAPARANRRCVQGLRCMMWRWRIIGLSQQKTIGVHASMSRRR